MESEDDGIKACFFDWNVAYTISNILPNLIFIRIFVECEVWASFEMQKHTFSKLNGLPQDASS